MNSVKLLAFTFLAATGTAVAMQQQPVSYALTSKRTATNINDLPDDCVKEIFKTTLNNTQQNPENISANKEMLQAKTLKRSCSKWHEIFKNMALSVNIDSQKKFNSFLKLNANQVEKINGVTLDGYWITDGSITSLVQKLPNLETLVVHSYCHNLTAACGTKIAQLKHLKELNLHYTKITDATLQAIAQGCSQLESLNLSDCKQLTGACGADIAKLTNLKRLYLRNTEITDITVQVIAAGCPLLEILDLSHCNNLSVAYGAALAQSTNLKQLDLSFSPNITDTTIQAIVTGCPNLEGLYLYCLNQLTEACGADIAKLKHLKALDICSNNITNKMIRVIAAGCTELEFLRANNITFRKNDFAQLIYQINEKIYFLCLGATAATLTIPLIQKLAGHAASHWPWSVAICAGTGALIAWLRQWLFVLRIRKCNTFCYVALSERYH